MEIVYIYIYVSKGGGGGGSHCLAFNWVSTLGQRNKSGRITTREVYVSNGFVEQYTILSHIYLYYKLNIPRRNCNLQLNLRVVKSRFFTPISYNAHIIYTLLI